MICAEGGGIVSGEMTVCVFRVFAGEVDTRLMAPSTLCPFNDVTVSSDYPENFEVSLSLHFHLSSFSFLHPM